MMDFIEVLQQFIDDFKKTNIKALLAEKIETDLNYKEIASLLRMSSIVVDKDEMLIKLYDNSPFFRDVVLKNSSDILHIASSILGEELVTIRIV